MFRVLPTETGKTFRLAMSGLLALSAAALAVTLWIMMDFLREQEIVRQLIRQLPPQATASAQQLAGELRWQFRLTILVVLNSIVTAAAVVLLWRAYRSSQASLRDVKALANDILNSVDQAIITTDLAGEITSINRRGLELFALQGDFVGRPIEHLSTAISLEQLRRDAESHGETAPAQDVSLPTNGALRRLRASCQPLRDYENQVIGSVVQLRDVTERVLMEERMRRMERYMGLGSIAAGLRHEIKNPLAALSLHAQLLEEQLDEQGASEEVREMLGVIKSEMARVEGVLESFRSFVALDNLNISEVDVGELLARQTKLIGPQAEQQKVCVDVSVPPAPAPLVQADQVRLEQVLLNLLVNALEAMPDGGRLALTVSLSPAQQPEWVELLVADTGPGIPDNLRERIFDPYFTTKREGTGMGLALCEKIIRQHDGTLDFQASEGGTVFRIRLPVIHDPKGESAKGTAWS